VAKRGSRTRREKVVDLDGGVLVPAVGYDFIDPPERSKRPSFERDVDMAGRSVGECHGGCIGACCVRESAILVGIDGGDVVGEVCGFDLSKRSHVLVVAHVAVKVAGRVRKREDRSQAFCSLFGNCQHCLTRK